MVDPNAARSTTQGRGAALAGWGAALVAWAAGALLLGALVLLATGRIGSSGVRLGLAVAALTATTLGVPLALDHRITRAYRRIDVTAASTRKQVLALWNVLLVAVALLAFPVTTRAALTQHGHWLFAGTTEGSSTALGRAIGRAASHIPRSDGAERTAAIATASPSASALASATTTATSRVSAPPAAGPSSSAAATEPLPVPDHDLTPQEVFRLRADSVVVIATRQRLGKGEPLAELYRELGVETIEGFGSGFVVEPAGVIVTNHHVVDQAESLRVTTRQGSAYPSVELLALDREHDLALLGITAEELRAAPLAPDDALSAGARAIAIGSPLGLDHSVTDGIISAMREIQGTSFLQMETTIAPGSSGGPLFDVRGRVIGVTTATRGGGLNLAVHVKYVRALLEQPRTSRKLATHVPGARVASLTVEGAETSAVERMQLEEALQLLCVGLQSCVKDAPAGPYLTLSYEAPSKASPVPTPGPVESNLTERDRACLKNNLSLTGAMVGMVMGQAFARPVGAGTSVVLVVEVAGLPGLSPQDAGAAGGTLTVRFRMGGSTAPPPDAG